MSDAASLGDRMKEHEQTFSHYLPRRIPVIIRLDGRAFHTFTRHYAEKFSLQFVGHMSAITSHLVNSIQGCEFAYSQSDEISLLLTDYKTIRTQPWFGYDINKMTSISAAMASSLLTKLTAKQVEFDSRAFSLPQDEVCNYFIWRQQDAVRNAIQIAGQEHFSHKELHDLSCDEIQEKLFQEKCIIFGNYSAVRKRGFCVVKGVVDTEIPIFTQDRQYVEKHVFVRED